jgi:hypothetical protein
MSQTLQDVLDAARQLPPDEQRRLAEQLLEEADQESRSDKQLTAEQVANLEIVDKLYGTIKGLDRETIIWLAEDEELCGY